VNGDSFKIITDKYAISVGAVQHIWKKYETHRIVTNYSEKDRKRATTSRNETPELFEWNEN